ncbi:MAG: hypothetical protein ABIH23_30420 [bacterium]
MVGIKEATKSPKRTATGRKNRGKALDAKEAATKALQYFKDLYPATVLSSILLEEVELSDDRKFWLITLGYMPQTANPFLPFGPGGREFKVFKVNSETGEVVSMKIKTFK